MICKCTLFEVTLKARIDIQCYGKLLYEIYNASQAFIVIPFYKDW